MTISHRSLRRVACSGLIIACFAVTAPHAAEQDEQDVAPGAVDRHHGRVSDLVLSAAERINRFLRESLAHEEDMEARMIQRFYGDRLSPGEVRGTYIMVTPSVTYHEKDGMDLDVDFSVRLRLRQIHERLKFFADRRDPDHDVMEGVFAPRHRRELEADRRESGSAGLMYMITEHTDRSLSLSGGLRYRKGVAPKIRLRGTLERPFEVWDARFAQSFFWDRVTGFGEKSELNFERPFTEIARFRTTSAATWSEASRGVEWGQFFSWYTHLSPRRSLSLTAGIRGHTHPSTVPQQYLIRVPYRQRIYRDWLFIEVEPGVDFHREENYRFTPLVTVGFDIVLGSFELE